METAKQNRSDTIPVFFPSIAPHLRESAVLKMLHEEEPTGKVRGSQWPPADTNIGHKPSSFFTKVSRGQGGRPVEWPPRPSQEENKQVSSNDAPAPPVPPRPANYPQASMDQSQQQQMVSQQQQVQQQQQHRQQNENAPNMTTTYPSGFKLRERAPVEQAPARVVTSQPAFKMTQPIRKPGDSKWPPKGNMEPTQQEVREFIKPRKSNKDYSEFFAQNALPHNYAAYRPPPGTQHHGGLEEGVSNM
ncbi:nuclear transcription factor Y subunit beta-like [Penaeus monodon]|uniref:nuclear transcription factor Y subunit beta-like n=1 Tax=Penaeus monodon TaxID=6687 RepID=UPI0018A76B4B|nr:nuclear transcription factor Y subunit beta-like [Penaeus monodon]